jgi:septal ring factor EnvC (AmiA/AmiB activator)
VHLPGGVEEYLEHVSAAEGGARAPKAAAPPPERAPDLRASEKDQRAARKELAKLERSIDRLAQKEAALHGQLAEHATDYAKITELDAQLRSVQREKAEIEEQWLALAELAD